MAVAPGHRAKLPIDTHASSDVLLVGLHQSKTKKKTPVAEIKAFIEEELLTAFEDCKAQYLIVSDGDYFRFNIDYLFNDNFRYFCYRFN